MDRRFFWPPDNLPVRVFPCSDSRSVDRISLICNVKQLWEKSPSLERQDGHIGMYIVIVFWWYELNLIDDFEPFVIGFNFFQNNDVIMEFQLAFN